MIEVKPIYSLSDICKIINKKSNRSAIAFLEAQGIPMNLIGNKYIVYLTDIQIHAPNLYSSILETHNIQQYKISTETMEYTKEQFRSSFFED